MTDDDRLRTILDVATTELDAPTALSRIREILREPEPSVEWLSSYPSRWDAHVGQWSLGISRKDDLFAAWAEHYTESIYAESGNLLSLDSAQARAVALYRALKGAE